MKNIKLLMSVLSALLMLACTQIPQNNKTPSFVGYFGLLVTKTPERLQCEKISMEIAKSLTQCHLSKTQDEWVCNFSPTQHPSFGNLNYLIFQNEGKCQKTSTLFNIMY